MPGPPLGPTSVPPFQDALKAQLMARPNIAAAGVNVVIGPPPAGVAQQRQWIALLGVQGTERWAAMGRLQKEEKYVQQIYISVLTHDGENDATVGRDMAYALRVEIANQLITDPTVSNTVWQAQIWDRNDFEPRLGIPITDAKGQPTTDLSWREAALYCSILVKNRM